MSKFQRMFNSFWITINNNCLNQDPPNLPDTIKTNHSFNEISPELKIFEHIN